METSKFKTNIKCTGCLSVVTPVLNEKLGENNWQVNLEDPQKVLSVPADSNPEEIIDAINKVGYQAEKI